MRSEGFKKEYSDALYAARPILSRIKVLIPKTKWTSRPTFKQIISSSTAMHADDENRYGQTLHDHKILDSSVSRSSSGNNRTIGLTNELLRCFYWHLLRHCREKFNGVYQFR